MAQGETTRAGGVLVVNSRAVCLSWRRWSQLNQTQKVIKIYGVPMIILRNNTDNRILTLMLQYFTLHPQDCHHITWWSLVDARWSIVTLKWVSSCQYYFSKLLSITWMSNLANFIMGGQCIHAIEASVYMVHVMSVDGRPDYAIQSKGIKPCDWL